MRFIAPLVAVGSALFIGACANKTSDSAPTAARADGSIRTVNTTCPVGGEAVGSETRAWNGASIGFCCAKCAGKFDAMSPAERDAVLARAKANK